MGDQKINPPRPPVEWDLPDFSEDADHPAKSFHDDHVGARHKADEAARLRQSDDRDAVERPRDLLSKHTKVAEAGSSPTAQDDDVQRRLRLLEQGQEPGQQATQDGKKQPALRERVGVDTTEHLSKVEQRLWAVMDGLAALSEELDHAQHHGPAGAERVALIEARLAKMELQLRHNMQLLLAGGVGLTLLADPRLTFKRLFDRIRRWPRRVRPGFRPDTDAEFDAFLAWVFEPPAAPEPGQDALGW